MNKLDAQFAIMKSISGTREVPETVVNNVLSVLEELDKKYVLDWIQENGIPTRIRISLKTARQSRTSQY